MLNIWTQLHYCLFYTWTQLQFSVLFHSWSEIILSKQHLTLWLVFSAIPKECVGHSSVSESTRGRKGQTATESGSLCYPCKEATVLFLNLSFFTIRILIYNTWSLLIQKLMSVRRWSLNIFQAKEDVTVVVIFIMIVIIIIIIVIIIIIILVLVVIILLLLIIIMSNSRTWIYGIPNSLVLFLSPFLKPQCLISLPNRTPHSLLVPF